MNAPALQPVRGRARARCLFSDHDVGAINMIRGRTAHVGSGKWHRSWHCSACRTTKLETLTRGDLDSGDIESAVDGWLLERAGRKFEVDTFGLGTFVVELRQGSQVVSKASHRFRSEATVEALEKASR